MYSLSDFDLETLSPQKLGEILVDAKKAYYTTGRPLMDDHTYDTLEAVLKKKSPYHRLFSKVGHDNFDTGWEKKSHSIPMGSQNKVSTYKDLIHYFELKNKSSPFLQRGTRGGFLVQPKCDGISLEIRYENGHLLDAITRGDGHTGDVITQNVVKMKQVVLTTAKKFNGSVRCEILVTKKDFVELNKLVKNEAGLYSNPRNAASGLSQRLDGLYSEFCTLYATDISGNFSTESEKISLLKNLGFTSVESHLCQSFEDIEKIYQNFLRRDRGVYPYDIDGLVVKINNLDIATSLGQKNGRPKYQVAYKFPADSNQSVIKNITWQVGPLGSITPVAEVEPVEISGAIINFASLGNYDLVLKKNLNTGDIIEISRRGDVIPHIEKVITKVNAGTTPIPTHCPACKTPLLKEDKFLRCPNGHHCLPQILGSLRLFCDKLNILGLSDKTIEKLYHSGKLKKPGDFYKLKVEDIANLDNLGEKSAKNVLHQIASKKTLSLKELFTAASIPDFSAARIQQLITAGFNTPEKLLDITLNDILSQKGFQKTLAQKIINGINFRKEWIISILINTSLITPKSHKGTLSGLTFAITGTLSRSRNSVIKEIENAGGKFHSAVSKNTSYLITNDTTTNSSKLTDAQKNGVKIINENDFQKLL